MKQLIKAVLAVCSWFTKIHNGCFILQSMTLDVYTFSIAFHIKLLNMRYKFAEGLAIR